MPLKLKTLQQIHLNNKSYCIIPVPLLLYLCLIMPVIFLQTVITSKLHGQIV